MVVNVSSKPSPPIKPILPDLDGVLRYWPSEAHLIEDKYGLPQGSIESVAFARENLDLAIRGVMEDAQWRELIVSELRRQYPKSDDGGSCEMLV